MQDSCQAIESAGTPAFGKDSVNAAIRLEKDRWGGCFSQAKSARWPVWLWMSAGDWL
jgi:hypothetical protein